MRQIGRLLVASILAIVVVAAGVVAYWVGGIGHSSPTSPDTINAVAAENFWGSLLEQMGGSHVQVHTIVSDPNADPHDYESTVADAMAVANAQLVVENGAGYDDWCQQLVASSDVPGQKVLNVGTLLGKSAGDNPHFWYGALYVRAMLAGLFADLVALAPNDANAFSANYAALNVSLQASVFGPEEQIRQNFSNVPVASTESIFQYMANSTGLDLISPTAFMDAVAEGVDPPASSVTEFEDQLTSGQVRLLVYNAQTVTPLTTQMQAIATSHNISIVAVTETLVPEGATFQAWMGGELAALQRALAP
jgi:zinc/manganese transport system substrate-binding protein